MATNGNGVFFKWAAGGLAVALGWAAVWAADTVSESVNANTQTTKEYVLKVEHVDDRVDSLTLAMRSKEIEDAKIILQLSEISKALGAKVVLDTAQAKRDSS